MSENELKLLALAQEASSVKLERLTVVVGITQEIEELLMATVLDKYKSDTTSQEYQAALGVVEGIRDAKRQAQTESILMRIQARIGKDEAAFIELLERNAIALEAIAAAQPSPPLIVPSTNGTIH